MTLGVCGRAHRMQFLNRLDRRVPSGIVLALVSVLVWTSAALGAAAASDASSVAVRVDYLPNLIYDGERLTLCGAVANPTPGAVQAVVSCSLVRDGKPPAKPVDIDVAAPAGKEAGFETGWVVEGLERTAVLAVTLRVGDRRVGQAEFAVVPASLHLPELTLGDDCLLDSDGRRAVLVVRRQIRERESKWLVVKLIERAVTGGKVRPASALFVGDLLAKDVDTSYVSLLRSNPSMSRFSFLGIAHPLDSERAGRAILRTLCSFSRSALTREYDMAVLFVGSEEARFGTDVDEFRKAVDLMCGLLRERGCRYIAIAEPVAPAALEPRVERYGEAVRSVAHAAAARTFNPQPAVASAGWGNAPWPGPDARRAVAHEIVRFVESVMVK